MVYLVYQEVGISLDPLLLGMLYSLCESSCLRLNVIHTHTPERIVTYFVSFHSTMVEIVSGFALSMKAAPIFQKKIQYRLYTIVQFIELFVCDPKVIMFFMESHLCGLSW